MAKKIVKRFSLGQSPQQILALNKKSDTSTKEREYVKKRYRTLSKLLHPDKAQASFPGNSLTKEQAQLFRRAFDVVTLARNTFAADGGKGQAEFNREQQVEVNRPANKEAIRRAKETADLKAAREQARQEKRAKQEAKAKERQAGRARVQSKLATAKSLAQALSKLQRGSGSAKRGSDLSKMDLQGLYHLRRRFDDQLGPIYTNSWQRDATWHQHASSAEQRQVDALKTRLAQTEGDARKAITEAYYEAKALWRAMQQPGAEDPYAALSALRKRLPVGYAMFPPEGRWLSEQLESIEHKLRGMQMSRVYRAAGRYR